jgi:hypothetical protein
MQCTWKDCPNEAKHPQVASDEQEWANLCDEHKSELDWSILQTGETQDIRSLMSVWIKAQGGAKKAAKRMIR